MCGVLAVVGDRASTRVHEGILRLAHRGVRSWVEEGPGWAIGHVRLPIVGVGEDHDQPIKKGRWSIGWVGEILGFKDLRPDLECDTDLVAETWVEEGSQGFHGFDGFWSVVAGDAKTGNVTCMVDYLAQKPLYVRVGDGWTAVGSEIDAIGSLAPVDVDHEYLSGVIRWGYSPSVLTPFKGVYQVPPGATWVLSSDGRIEATGVDVVRPSTVNQDQLRRLIEEAVRVRVTSSDVPVAALVSGGLDSSIVKILADRYGDVRGYHSDVGHETPFARFVDPNVSVVPGGHSRTPDDVVHYMQEPVDLGSVAPQIDLSEGIARAGGETVCLTGDGADEMFGGYGRALRYDSQATDVWSELVRYHLPRLDRVMMRNKIEVRSPFLARPVVAAALGLPRAARIAKSTLKDIFQGVVPSEIIDRPKVPLRSDRVTQDREGWSRSLVRSFVKKWGGSFDA